MKIYFNHSLEKKQLKKLLFWFHQRYGYSKTRNLADTLKTMGFHYATYAGISLGVDDLQIPPLKTQLVNNAEEEVLKTDFLYQRGEITSIERFQKVIEAWTWTSENVKEEVLQYFKYYQKLNPVYMMAFSGARGNISQVRQLVGMRGLMSDPQGNLIDVPIKNNFREGLSIIEYVISCYGARKGIVDTALKTANSGYLTRRLVEAAQAVTIYNTDCNTNQGIFISHIKDEEGGVLSSLEERLTGRVLMESIYIQSHLAQAQKHHPVYWDECVSRYLQATRERRSEFASQFNSTPTFTTSSVVPELRYGTKADMQKVKAIYKNQDIKPLEARIIRQYYTQVRIRSPLTCSTNNSKVCQLCYGWNLSQNRIVSLGEAVGIIAAQSIGEPGTQLTMRTFHTGGVFSGDVGQKVVSPSDGYVYISDGYPLQSYESSLSLFGRKVRTQLGENAFFTYTDFYVAISNASLTLKEESGNGKLHEALGNESYTADTLQAGEYTKEAVHMHYALRSNKCNIGYNTKYTDSRITIYTFPSQTLLFVTPGEYVKKKQIIAEVPEKYFSETDEVREDAYDLHTKSKKHDSYQATQECNADNAISTSDTGVYAYANPQSSDSFLHSSVQQENTYEHDTAHEEKVEVVSDFSGQVFIQAHERLGLPSYNLASGHISTSGTQQLHTQNKPCFWRTAEPMNLWVLSGNKIQVNLSFLRGDKCVTAFSNPPSNSSLFQYKGESTHKSAWSAYSYEIRTSFLRLHTNINTRSNHYAHEQDAPTLHESVRQCRKYKYVSNARFTTPSLERVTRFNGNGVRTYANSKMINRLKNKNTLAYHHDHQAIRESRAGLSTTAGLETYEPNLREKNNLPLYADNYLERRCISQPVLHGNKAVKHKDTQNSWTDAYKDTHTHTHNKNYALGSKQMNAHFTYLVLDKNIEKQFTLCNDCTENKIGQLLKKGSVIPQSVHSHSSVGLRKNMHNQATQECNYGKIPETCVITEMQSALHQHQDIAALKAKNENDFNLHIVPSSRLGEYQDISVSLYQPIHGLTGHPSMCVSAHVNDNASRSKFADINFIRKSLEKLKWANTYYTVNAFTDAIIPPTFSCNLHQSTLQSDVSRSQECSMKSPVDDHLQLHYASVTGNDALHHISVSEPDYEIHSRVACYSQRSRIHGYEDHGYDYCTTPPYADKYTPRAGLLANSRMRIILSHKEKTQNEKCITIKTRQVKPYLLSTGASSKLQQWQIVDACEYLFQLPYNREKTGDIVQGLPKIEQFFEARKKLYNNPKTLSVKNFFFFRKKGLSAFISTFLAFRNVQNLCLHSVQRVYQAQGILLSDKHIEIIVRRMTSYVLLLHPGNTSFLPGEIIEYQLLRHLTMSANTSAASPAQVSAENPMIFLPYIIGITKVSLSNYRTSFLSAASFQETRRILMNSALEGCIDYLDELKQPVMLGKTIPAGIAFFYEQNVP